jgi:hypothetical protein
VRKTEANGTETQSNNCIPKTHMGAWQGVYKGVEDGHRLPVLRAGHPQNGHKAISGVACPPGIEGLGMAGPAETLGSP